MAVLDNPVGGKGFYEQAKESETPSSYCKEHSNLTNLSMHVEDLAQTLADPPDSYNTSFPSSAGFTELYLMFSNCAGLRVPRNVCEWPANDESNCIPSHEAGWPTGLG